MFSVDVSGLARSRARLFQDREIFDEKFDYKPAEFKSAASKNGRVKQAAAAGRNHGVAEYLKARLDGHEFGRCVTRSFRLFQL